MPFPTQRNIKWGTGFNHMRTKTTTLGCRRVARNINASMVFGPDIEDAIPFAESVEWIRQFAKQAVPESGYFLVVGSESSPTEIWHGPKNNIDSYFTCIYADVDMPEQSEET